MTKKRKQFDKGIKLRPDTTAVTEEGEIKYDDSAKKLQYQDDSATRSVVSEDGTQTLTNKSIDADNNTVSNLEVDNLKAGVLSTDISASGTDTELPSAKAVRDHVAAQIATKDEASEISYSNTTSGLSATDVQAALDEIDSNADNHLADTVDAHDASAISYVNTTSGLTATEVQAAVDEVDGNLDNHLADTVDAHDASAISYVDNHSISQTEVQGAIDTIISGHVDQSSDVHGIGAGNDVVGTGTTQTLTNKTLTSPTITGASFQTPSRLDVKKDIEANLVTYAASATDGELVFATDTDKYYGIVSGALVPLDSAAGFSDPDTLFLNNAEGAIITDWTTTSGNAGGGSVVISETDPINGSEVFLMTHPTSGVDPQELTRTFDVPPKFRGKNLSFILDVNSQAPFGDVVVYITDETNATLLVNSEAISVVDDVSSSVKSLITFDCPASCLSITYTVAGLVQGGATETRIDDITLKLTKRESTEISQVKQEENVFSARINGSDGAINSQSSPFIANVAHTPGTGIYDITFTAGLFSEEPSITTTVDMENPTGTDRATLINNSDATGCRVRVLSFSNVATDHDFTITVIRQGADYKNKTVSVEREQSTFHEVLVEEADSYIYLDTAVAKVAGDDVSFANITKQGGTELSYNAATGRITALSDGLYDISGTFAINSAGNVNVRVNGTDIIQAHKTQHAGDELPISTEYYLNEGDYVTLHLATGDVASLSSWRFQVAKKGKVKVASVAPESKVKIPTSELRMEGATSRGTGLEAYTVKYNTFSKVRGSGISVDNSNGTVITVIKSGKISVAASLYSSVSNYTIYLTKNTANASIAPTESETVVTSGESSGFGNSISAEFFVEAGDVLRVASVSNPTSGTPAVLEITHQEQEIQVAVSNVTPQYEDADSMVRLNTSNGYGSTGTKIRRFSNVLDNIGSAITYTDSATDGASFTINEKGFYTISYTDYEQTSSLRVGISINSTELSTNISSINPDNHLASDFTGPADGTSANASWSGILNVGDIIRPHTDGFASSGGQVSFTIAKVGVPSIAEVDVTPFVDFHENRFESTDWVNAGPLPFSAETTAPTKGGTVIDSFRWRRNGDSMEGILRLYWNSAGSAGSGDYIVDVFRATGYRIDSTKLDAATGADTLNATILGSCRVSNTNLENTTTSSIGVTTYGNNDALKFQLLNASNTNRHWGSDVFPLSNSTGYFSATFTVPIEGWTSYEDNYERIYAIEQNENEFSARINNNSTASIASQSNSFIKTVNRSAPGVVDVEFVDGFFTEVPAVVITPINSNFYSNTTAISSSSVTVRTAGDTGVPADSAFDIHVSRQGADRKDLGRQLAVISDFPRVNKQLSQTFLSTTTSTKIGNIVEFSPAINGDSLITYDSSTGKYTCLRNGVKVSVSSSTTGVAADNNFIYVNGSVVGQDTTGAGWAAGSSFNGILNKDDELWVQTGGTLSGAAHYFSMLAEAQELERVDSSTLGIEEHLIGYQSNFWDSTGGTNFWDFTLFENNSVASSDFIEALDETTPAATVIRAKRDTKVSVTLMGEYGSGVAILSLTKYNAGGVGGRTIGWEQKSTSSSNQLDASVSATVILKKGEMISGYLSTGYSSRSGGIIITCEPASHDVIVAIPEAQVAIIEQRGNGSAQALTTVYATLGFNTLSDDGDFLSFDNDTDRFTVPAGEYIIDATLLSEQLTSSYGAIYYKLVNVTDTIDYYSIPAYVNTNNYSSTRIYEKLTLTKQTTFEIQGRKSGGGTVNFGHLIAAPNDKSAFISVKKLR